MNCIERSKLQLRPHQAKAIRYLFNNGDDIDGLLLVHPPGTGKTLTAVTASQCFLDMDPEHQVIFVGPSSLITNFRKELIAYGVKNEKRYKLYSYQKFLQTDEKQRDTICKNNMLIVDEVHNLRNLNLRSKNQGKRSKSVLKCATKARKRLLLTATPFVNDLSDFIPIVNYLYGKIMIQTKGDASTVKKTNSLFERPCSFYFCPKRI